MSEQALDHELDKLSEEEEIEQHVKGQLRNLAEQRNKLEEEKHLLAKAQELLEGHRLYKDVLHYQAITKERNAIVADLTSFIKDDALMLSAFTNYEDRKPVSGIEIKQFTVVNITDERIAKIWAAQNAPDTLSIKKAPFNKIAKVMNLDFVNKSTEYRAQVSSNLSEYLDEN